MRTLSRCLVPLFLAGCLTAGTAVSASAAVQDPFPAADRKDSDRRDSAWEDSDACDFSVETLKDLDGLRDAINECAKQYTEGAWQNGGGAGGSGLDEDRGDDGLQDEDRQDEGRQDAGQKDQGRQEEGQQGEGRQDEGQQDAGHQDDGLQDEGRQDEGRQDEGRQDDGLQGEGPRDGEWPQKDWNDEEWCGWIQENRGWLESHGLAGLPEGGSVQTSHTSWEYGDDGALEREDEAGRHDRSNKDERDAVGSAILCTLAKIFGSREECGAAKH
ncbi:hypothetical protein GCM10010358_30660 [Streptomyces minutiscleroticus]|uniref:Secreted protein n=1 Tax=Streptomyces minutiscleroticus TaxID=68238 RepID=A0A918KUP1_9ACTN|nr:hypothetical protein [Streptomyces minutiscleroticus]GGX74156.1 hypothetical protein GCM10010358_30660 [Streptomyces minutiscleroticus]